MKLKKSIEVGETYKIKQSSFIVKIVAKFDNNDFPYVGIVDNRLLHTFSEEGISQSISKDYLVLDLSPPIAFGKLSKVKWLVRDLTGDLYGTDKEPEKSPEGLVLKHKLDFVYDLAGYWVDEYYLEQLKRVHDCVEIPDFQNQ